MLLDQVSAEGGLHKRSSGMRLLELSQPRPPKSSARKSSRGGKGKEEEDDAEEKPPREIKVDKERAHYLRKITDHALEVESLREEIS